MERGYIFQGGYVQVIGLDFTPPEGAVQVPLRPSPWHNFMAGAWVEDVVAADAALADQIRRERDQRLRDEVDVLVTNPLRWGELPVERREAIIAHRAALLAVPEQVGFPRDVIWPELC